MTKIEVTYAGRSQFEATITVTDEEKHPGKEFKLIITQVTTSNNSEKGLHITAEQGELICNEKRTVALVQFNWKE